MTNITLDTLEFIDLLINQHHAEVNTQDAKGKTPLLNLINTIVTRKPGLYEDQDDLEFKLVKILLAVGADPNIKSKEGRSPFTLAFEHGHTHLLDLLGGQINLNKDPSLFFALSNPLLILNKAT
jgi:ankyrin repeat protein